METTTIVTATYGDSDLPFRQVEQDVPTRWLCYTDNPSLAAPEPWRVIFEEPRYPHPNMAAKWHKLWPIFCPMIWVDANMEVTSPTFAREALASIHDGVALYRHPRRDCIYEEAEASLGAESQAGKYDGQPITEQVAHYREEGHPEHGGLWACGTIAWDVENTKAWRLGAAWLSECERWSFQDQISFPVVARRLGLEPGTFPHRQLERRRGGYLSNRWLRIYPHR